MDGWDDLKDSGPPRGGGGGRVEMYGFNESRKKEDFIFTSSFCSIL